MSGPENGNDGKRANRLMGEKSPYLLQHAYNPVNWMPWGEEAFKMARELDKPVFLSIGYSTCHWCHVMERESFEDPEVAALINDSFVPIKVDREERPDLDAVYMEACQLLSGQGGWPLTIIMTPDKKPFFGGTYFPKRSRFGRIGMIELVPRVARAWKEEKHKIEPLTKNLLEAMKEGSRAASGPELGLASLHGAESQLTRAFDNVFAGFGMAPKFPSPHNLTFLLRYHKRTGGRGALSMAEATLQAMRLGGVYDHLGFGFHRYSTDREWLVPHFEKMLYDQAMLAMAYAEAFQLTGKEEYAQVTREVLEYVSRDMTSPEGAFHSAEDADSEGEEGKFYVWTTREMEEILGEEDAKLMARIWNVSEAGNFKDETTGAGSGANILHLKKPLSELAPDLGTPLEDLKIKMEEARRKLLAKRSKRPRPHKDDKILTDWNGLMIAALAKAAVALNDETYSAAAARAADFLLDTTRSSDGGLLHRYREGEAAIPGFLDDYAFLSWGLIELYQATFSPRWLEAALDLTRRVIAGFEDKEAGGFFLSREPAGEALARHKDAYDGAIPSGNSVAALNLLRLGRMTGAPDLEEKAGRIFSAFRGAVSNAPMAYSMMMSALDYGLGPTTEVVVTGSHADGKVADMIAEARKGFNPSRTVVLADEEKADAVIRLADFVRHMKGIGGKAAAYACKGGECSSPVHDPQELARALTA